jgi:transposase
VERARLIRRAGRGETPPAIAAALGVDAETVRRRIRRFNAEGLAAFDDHHRSGRPATYSPDEVATVIAAALTSPRGLGLPFAAWTLDRLVAYLREHKGIAMRRSRIDEILLKEGLRWRRQETWFGARVGSTPSSRQKGADRDALHRAAAWRRSRLPGRDGTAQRQELSGQGPGSTTAAAGGPGSPGDRLRPARQGLRLRRLLPGDRRRLHAALPEP